MAGSFLSPGSIIDVEMETFAEVVVVAFVLLPEQLLFWPCLHCESPEGQEEKKRPKKEEEGKGKPYKGLLFLCDFPGH